MVSAIDLSKTAWGTAGHEGAANHIKHLAVGYTSPVVEIPCGSYAVSCGVRRIVTAMVEITAKTDRDALLARTCCTRLTFWACSVTGREAFRACLRSRAERNLWIWSWILRWNLAAPAAANDKENAKQQLKRLSHCSSSLLWILGR